MSLRRNIFSFLISFIILGNGSYSQEINSLNLTGPYFGQNPPGETPKIFANGIISGVYDLHATPVFSPEMNEMYWAVLDRSNNDITIAIYYSKMIDNQWTDPEIASFNSANIDDNPVFHPNGQKLFFNSNRPYNGFEKERIWFVTRLAEDSWSDPEPISAIVNDEHLHWQISIDENNTIYFGSGRTPSFGIDDIFYTLYEEGNYTNPVNMGSTINSSEMESMPFIDPQGNYIIYSYYANNIGSFLISYKIEDGSWSQPINITNDYPEISGICPQITPDGEYFFFTDGYIYWVKASLIFNRYLSNKETQSVPENNFKVYPNPFNECTTMEYSIQQNCNVRIEIYNSLSQQVKTLCNKYHSVGKYQIIWDGTDNNYSKLKQGIYYCIINTKYENKNLRILYIN